MRYPGFLNERRPACLTLLFTSVTFLLFLATCNDDGLIRSKQTAPTARVISQTSCKEIQYSPPVSAGVPCSQDCIEYWSESTGTLRIKHINAAFNCCMKSLSVTVEIIGEVALITEGDRMENGGCGCICLYDVVYEISNLPAGVRKIEVVEPYAKLDQWPEERPLCCSFVQPVTDTGNCCVERCHYPWGFTLLPRIRVLSVVGCKFESGANRVYPSECALWEYHPDNTLAISHVNAQLNCCLDSITVRMELRGDTIMIVETEHTPACDCVCPYDVNLYISGIVPGRYHFVIRYGPWDEGIPKLAWSTDLRIAPTGEYCIDFSGGPD